MKNISSFTSASGKSGIGNGSVASPIPPTTMLLLACAAAIALYFVPYAGYITYPIRLLVTFIHEGCHALVGLLTGAWVQSISIAPDGSGLTYTRGGFPVLGPILTSSAGYLGATLYGAALIGSLRRGVAGRYLLLATGAFVVLETLGAIRPWANPFGFFWGAILAVALLAGGLKLSPIAANWVASFIGVQCVLNALFDLRTLFEISVTNGGHSDAMNMQQMTWIPAPVWASVWILTAFAMLWFVLRPARRAVSVKI